MSQLRKQREKQEKKSKIIITGGISLIIILLLAGGVYFLYQEFFAPKPPESFIPSDPTSFISINLKQNPDQNETIKKLGARLGDENLLENTIKSIIFPGLNEDELQLPDEEKIKSWIGVKIGLSNFKVSPTTSLSAFIIELKNPELAKKFLHTFEENLKKQGNVVETEDFRNTKITNVKGHTELAYAINYNYLLISQKSDGIKKMIDTRAGRFDSLNGARDYYITKRKVKAKNSLAFGYLDTVEFLKIIYSFSTKNVDTNILNTLGAINKNDYLGISVIPEENGAHIIGFTKKEEKTEKSADKTKLTFDKIIPEDITASFEGKNLKPFLEDMIFGEANLKQETLANKELIKKGLQLETGVDLENDFLSLFDNPYVIAVFPASDKLDAGIILDVKKEKELLKKLGNVENAATNLLNKYVTKDDKVNFTDHNYNETKYRYLNLPDKYVADVNYALVSDYLILATSENAVKKLIDSVSGKTQNPLIKNASYKTSLEKLNKKEPHQLMFFNIQNIIKLTNKYIRFDYEKLDKRAKQLNTLAIVHEEREDGSFFDSFLEIK